MTKIYTAKSFDFLHYRTKTPAIKTRSKTSKITLKYSGTQLVELVLDGVNWTLVLDTSLGQKQKQEYFFLLKFKNQRFEDRKRHPELLLKKIIRLGHCFNRSGLFSVVGCEKLFLWLSGQELQTLGSQCSWPIRSKPFT